MLEFIVHIGLLSAATWRLASLLSSEDGPLDMFLSMRLWAGMQYRWDNGAKTPYIPEWDDVKPHDIPLGSPFQTMRGTGAYARWSMMKGLCCVWCQSVWWGFLLALLYWAWPTQTIGAAVPLVISAAAIWLDRRVR